MELLAFSGVAVATAIAVPLVAISTLGIAVSLWYKH
jgi:hypothetical protein